MEHRGDRREGIYAADATFVDPRGVLDRDSYVEYVPSIRSAVPDFTADIGEPFDTEDGAGCRCTISGTMEGAYQGLAPTGESFEHHVFTMYHTADRKVVRWWNATDTMAMARQTGGL